MMKEDAISVTIYSYNFTLINKYGRSLQFWNRCLFGKFAT